MKRSRHFVIRFWPGWPAGRGGTRPSWPPRLPCSWPRSLALPPARFSWNGSEPAPRESELAVRNYGYAYEAAETMLSRVGDVDLADIPQMEPVRVELLEDGQASI